ncbi:MAG: alpha/beta fold hydrolase [Stellaceae bacterium]
MTSFTSRFITANGIRLHYVREGHGAPLLLLHGWPEFGYVWRKCIPALARDFDVIAPDLRGFGDSDKPSPGPSADAGAEVHAADIAALIDGLGLAPVGIVSHDVGAYVAQSLARLHPERLSGLFFFNCPYPGIGGRWAAPDHLIEIWYQSFHQQSWAAELVGSSRAACRTYFRHFLSHWAHDPHAFDEDLEAWVDNFMKPGNLQGGFNWYISAHQARLAVMRGEVPRPLRAPIALPTRVLWGESDPILRSAWADRIGEFFSNATVTTVPEVGHFVHYEKPDLACREIRGFFTRLQEGT